MKREMKPILVSAIVSVSVLLLAIFIFGLTGRATENSSSSTPADEVVLGNETDFIEPSCNQGDARGYTCPDGTKVEWCHCNNNLWICINSPENSCNNTLQTCPGIVCGEGVDPIFTGNYENNCPIYYCPNSRCSSGIASEYVCPDGTSVPDCHCINGEWECRANPEEQCPNLICPEGCVCNRNTIACSYSGNVTTTTASSSGGGGVAVMGEVCPAGCSCTESQIVCNETLTSKGNCAIGCQLQDNCVLSGFRISKTYCDANSEWKMQKTMDDLCDNNFECETNLCIDGKCLTHNFLERFFAWFRKTFGG